jgi:DNA-binding transcriptional MocR family regulator
LDSDRHISARALVRQLGQWRSGSGSTAYASLAERIVLLVQDGRLPLNTRMPAERELAAALRISRTTVAAGYDLLRESGHLRSRRGAGSWTTMPTDTSAIDPTPFAPSGSAAEFDLAYAASAAPYQALTEAVASASAQLHEYASCSGYQLLGIDSLRDAVADYYTAQGVPTGRDQIMVTSGAQHAISVVLAALVKPGERVLVEHPTYANALDAITREHARAVPVGFPTQEWDLEAMAAAVRDACPRLMYLIPDYQNPTGLLMSGAQRDEVVALARRTRTPLLVDETMADITLDGNGPTPMAAHLPENSSLPLITIGSASKTFWGGLRIGWVRATPAMIEQLARARASVDIATPMFDQLVVRHLLAEIDTVLAPRLATLRSARDHLLKLVCTHFPSWRTSKPTGGLSLWVDLGRPASNALVSASARHGVLLAAGPRFGVDGAFESYLRLPYTLPEPSLEEAVARMASAWAELPHAELAGALRWPGAPAEVA